MSWFKVDDKVHGSMKRLKVSTAAMGLWACAGSWAKDKKTGGFIPREALRALAPDLSDEQRFALAAELVGAAVDGIHEHGFWLPMPNGWQFHDWETYQTDDEIETERRETIREIRRKAGLLGAQARWSRDDGKPDGKHQFAMFANGSPDPISGSDPISSPVGSTDQTNQNSSAPSEPSDLTGSAREDDDDSEPSEKKSPFRSDAEREVFECWATKLWPLVHKQGAPRATGPRLSKIRARLAQKRTVAELKRVVEAVAQSPWHLGENDAGKAYIEPKTIFRNSETVDEWLTKRAGKPPGAVEHEERERDARILEQAKAGEWGARAQVLALNGTLNLEKLKVAIRDKRVTRCAPTRHRAAEPVSSPRATSAPSAIGNAAQAVLAAAGVKL